MLSESELSRYSRNLLISEIGEKGQEKLKKSTVTMIGAGGLGSPALFYLASAGVGHIKIIDSDMCELSNLQRQILFKTNSVGQPKAWQAASTLKDLNPEIEIISVKKRLTPENAEELLAYSDIVIEGSDNFDTKFLTNDICYFLKIPTIIAGVVRFEGVVMGTRQGDDPCYRCVFESPPPSKSVPHPSDSGVLGSVAGFAGCMQATEAIKFLISQDEDSIFGHVFSFDLLKMDFRKTKITKNSNCPLCGENSTIDENSLKAKANSQSLDFSI
ncbi:MAG: HesA/MoeB/ThiF family protein [Leptospiraceae bacterium]|nr:HesA/MoeB/ThiF family protein [Leptospiraceae bacterium]MCP5496316.1 HesA/MoeB/ThiF family protein [Leptospiraceae bacterium]